jgi:hypothetical protein
MRRNSRHLAANEVEMKWNSRHLAAIEARIWTTKPLARLQATRTKMRRNSRHLAANEVEMKWNSRHLVDTINHLVAKKIG